MEKDEIEIDEIEIDEKRLAQLIARRDRERAAIEAGDVGDREVLGLDGKPLPRRNFTIFDVVLEHEIPIPDRVTKPRDPGKQRKS